MSLILRQKCEKILSDKCFNFTLTLPTSPILGTIIRISDKSNWNTNNLIIARNNSTIEGLSENLVLDIHGVSVELIYDGTTWQVFVA